MAADGFFSYQIITRINTLSLIEFGLVEDTSSPKTIKT